MREEKRFEKPIANVIEFDDADIVSTSSIGGINYPWWGGDGFDGPDTPADR